MAGLHNVLCAMMNLSRGAKQKLDRKKTEMARDISVVHLDK